LKSDGPFPRLCGRRGGCVFGLRGRRIGISVRGMYVSNFFLGGTLDGLGMLKGEAWDIPLGFLSLL
jgi:hypothetical protein